MNIYFHKAINLFHSRCGNTHKIVFHTGLFLGVLFSLYLISSPVTEGHTLVYVRILAIVAIDASSPSGTDQLYVTVNGDATYGLVWGPFIVVPYIVLDFFGSLAVPFHNYCWIKFWNAKSGPDTWLGTCLISRSLVGAGARTCHFTKGGAHYDLTIAVEYTACGP